MERYVCIHGHFYQPPRENPWLEAIEIQDSAYPYHDWNERITAESYAPNSASRLLDGEGCITDIVSNYEKISFNFGPTLLSWMEKAAPETYAAIIESDKKSAAARSGHGNALAQAYNHIIMPLANSRDKRTQIIWGIADFKHRFGRLPEGMWLPETAVDTETLELMAAHHIAFTILAPSQASAFRKIGAEEWQDAAGAVIDPTRAYACPLPSGRTITIFFYDGPISRAVAFERLLERGEDFANRLLSGFTETRDWDQLGNIATDGESYGHHHRFGDMALAYAIHHIEQNGLARLTNYADYLENHPPEYEARIFDNTSWSCAHGVERWKSNCGCNSGGHSGWSQEWRTPLRAALDWLRDKIKPHFEEKGAAYFKNPWNARNDYIRLILDRSEENISAFFKTHAAGKLGPAERTAALELMEMQRHAMLMYTSCGWFFDELSGIETVQVIYYAGRVLQLAGKVLALNMEKDFRKRLSKAKSNLAQYGDGAKIYDDIIKPAIVNLEKVAAHYAISSFSSDYGETSKVYSYSVTRKDSEMMQTGEARIAVGNIEVASEITLESCPFSYAVLRLGGHIFNAGIRKYTNEEFYRAMKEEALATFQKGNIVDMIRHMDQQFGLETYSLVNLFKDQQRKILKSAISKTLEDFEHEHRLLYENHKILMNFLQGTGMPVPRVFVAAAEFTITSDLKEAFSAEKIESDRVRAAISDAEKWHIPLDSADLEFMLRRRGEDMLRKLRVAPNATTTLNEFLSMMELLRSMPLQVNFWDMQNSYFSIAKGPYRDFLEQASDGNDSAQAWTEAFRRVGDLLYFNIEAVLPKPVEAA